MAPMGDDVANQCRWAANAAAENDSELIDLPPSEQVSRGKELLSMLSGFGGGKENSSGLQLFQAQQPQSEQRRPTAGLRITAPAEPAVSSAMLASHPQDRSQMPGYHPAAAVVEAQPQVAGFADLAADWMMSQGHFASRPSLPSLSPTSSPPVPTWGSSGSGLSHAANAPAGYPWAALSTTPPGGRAHSWPMGTAPPDAQQLAGGSPAMHMHGPAMTRGPSTGGLPSAPEAASWATPGHSVARVAGVPENALAYASWSSASLGSSVSPTMASLHHAQTPAAFPALATAAPMTAMSYADQPTMFTRNQMRAEAAPYVPGTTTALGVGVQAC